MGIAEQGWQLLLDLGLGDASISAALSSAFFMVAGAAFMLGELVAPARRQRWSRGLVWNTIGMTFSGIVTVLLITLVDALLGGVRSPLASFDATTRIVVFFFATDYARYWAHRLMHVAALWRVHRFHHSIEVVHWYAGNRASMFHLTLWIVPMGVLGWLLDVGVGALLGCAVINVFWQHLMHANLAIPARIQRAMEWVVATPRYHHIHHSRDPAHESVNFTNIFTLWDRLGRTYYDPDQLDPAALEFGLVEDSPPPLARQLVGL